MLVFALILTTFLRLTHTYCCGNYYEQAAKDDGDLPDEERQLLPPEQNEQQANLNQDLNAVNGGD